MTRGAGAHGMEKCQKNLGQDFTRLCKFNLRAPVELVAPCASKWLGAILSDVRTMEAGATALTVVMYPIHDKLL